MEGAVKELFKITISPEDIKMGTYEIWFHKVNSESYLNQSLCFKQPVSCIVSAEKMFKTLGGTDFWLKCDAAAQKLPVLNGPFLITESFHIGNFWKLIISPHAEKKTSRCTVERSGWIKVFHLSCDSFSRLEAGGVVWFKNVPDVILNPSHLWWKPPPTRF